VVLQIKNGPRPNIRKDTGTENENQEFLTNDTDTRPYFVLAIVSIVRLSTAMYSL